MAKSCVTEKTALRQRWIENGLLELMQQKKYGQITVTDLCSYLNLSRRSFYRYFDDLNDVINSMLDRTFQNLAVVPLNPSVEDLRQCFAFWMERKDLLDALYQGGMIEKLFKFTLRYTNFRAADTAQNSPALEEDAQLFVIGGFMSLIISWQRSGFQKTPEEMARTAHTMLYEPFILSK